MWKHIQVSHYMALCAEHSPQCHLEIGTVSLQASSKDISLNLLQWTSWFSPRLTFTFHITWLLDYL